MIINNKKFLSYFLLFSILFLNCKVDYDIDEIAPQEHLNSEHNNEHNNEHNHEHTDEEECPECNSEHTDEDVCPECDSEQEHTHEHLEGEECTECDSEQEHTHEHVEGEECTECDSEQLDSEDVNITEQVDDSHSGHNHAEGARNHGTEWFFNQPWAAPFIWPKLFRDALIFLGLAVALFIITARKGKK